MKRKNTKMNYETTETLFHHMNTLETYSQMYSTEIHKSDPDWEAVARFNDYVKESRKRIFELVQDKQDV